MDVEGLLEVVQVLVVRPRDDERVARTGRPHPSRHDGEGVLVLRDQDAIAGPPGDEVADEALVARRLVVVHAAHPGAPTRLGGDGGSTAADPGRGR
jgi:hypothetical protein